MSIILNGEQRKIVLLDTNVIRTIIESENVFILFETKFINEGYIPSFSFYSVIELMKNKDRYNDFIKIFGIKIPCLMFYTFKQIIEEEYKEYLNNKKLEITNNIAYPFTPKRPNNSIENFFSNRNLLEAIDREKSFLNETSNFWNAEIKKSKLCLAKNKPTENYSNDNFYKKYEKKIIIKDLLNLGLTVNDNIDISKLPSIRVLEYSHFDRAYVRTNKFEANDVMDVRIAAIAPYVDSIITEKYQASVYSKIKNIVKEIKDLKVYKIGDLGWQGTY